MIFVESLFGLTAPHRSGAGCFEEIFSQSAKMKLPRAKVIFHAWWAGYHGEASTCPFGLKFDINFPRTEVEHSCFSFEFYGVGRVSVGDMITVHL